MSVGTHAIHTNSDGSVSGLVYTADAGSTGADWTPNAYGLPEIGAATFGGASPYAAYHLIATVPANPNRQALDIENISGAQIVILRDDGVAAEGAAPANASVFSLAGGSAAGAQGGSWSSTTFRGRLQIYGPTGAETVTVMED